jgi:hypothetical protein
MLANVSCNIDNGIMSGAAESIKSDMGIDNLKFGMLGTIIFFGLSIGSIYAMKAFSTFDHIQGVLVTSFAVLAVLIVAFTVTDVYDLNVALRLL